MSRPVIKHRDKGVNRPMGKIEFDEDFFEDMGEVGCEEPGTRGLAAWHGRDTVSCGQCLQRAV